MSSNNIVRNQFLILLAGLILIGTAIFYQKTQQEPQIEEHAVVEQKVVEAPEIQCRLLHVEELPEEEPLDLRYSNILISDEEKTLMALCIYHESRGENFEGQRAVAEVILNRVKSDKWPNSVKDVIYQDRQFDCANYLTTANINEPEKLTMAYDVIDFVVSNDDYVFDENMGYFKTTPYTSCSYVQLGNHYFAHM